MFKALSALIFAALLLSSCSGMRVVDSQVNSFAPAPVPAGSRYTFERLPSQQNKPDTQAQLETMAEEALTKVGLVRDDQAASYSVQVSVTQRVEQSASDHPAFGWNLGWHSGRGAWFPWLDVRTNYWREVGLVMRNRDTQAVVFESHASHDGPWADTEAVLPAMLDAALQGFPEPPSGVRRVNIEIAR